MRTPVGRPSSTTITASACSSDSTATEVDLAIDYAEDARLGSDAAVPYVEEADHYFLKTIIPSRKATRDYLKQGDRDVED